jgi:hypothetical protein
MKANHVNGIISENFQGVGTVNHDSVVRRAREIALINGRPPNHYTQEDFQEAKRELTGADLDNADGEVVASITTWDENPNSSGHPVEKEEAADEQSVEEQLVEQGVNEAEHEQMFEGAKTPKNQE